MSVRSLKRRFSACLAPLGSNAGTWLVLVSFQILIATDLILLKAIRQRHWITSTDDGLFTQVAFNTFHGSFLKTTLQLQKLGLNEVSFLGIHSSPAILFMIAPFSLFPETLTLSIWQIIWLVMGSLPLFLLAREKKFSEWESLALTLVYLLSPCLLINSLWLRMTTFSLPLIFWIFYFHKVGRIRLFTLSFLLLVFAKENMALVGSFMGIFLYLEGNKKTGTLMFLFGLVWFLVSVWVLIPFFSMGQNNLSHFFHISTSELGGVSEGSSTLIIIKNMALLFCAFLFLPLFSPKYLVLLIPGLLMFLVGGGNKFLPTITVRFAVYFIPILVLASLNTLVGFEKTSTRKIFVFGLLLWTVLQHLIFPNSFAFSSFRKEHLAWAEKMEVEPHVEIGVLEKKLFPQIQPSEKISVSHKMTHILSKRRWIYTFPLNWNECDWLIIDVQFPGDYPFKSKEEFEGTLKEIKRSEDFSVEFLGKRYWVLKKITVSLNK